VLERAFRAEDFDQLPVDGHLDAGRNLYRQLANA
jgi:hypothetical protein